MIQSSITDGNITLLPILYPAALAVYTELASMFPNRSGAEVVYLEQAYPRPRFLVPVSFAVTTVLLSYASLFALLYRIPKSKYSVY